MIAYNHTQSVKFINVVKRKVWCWQPQECGNLVSSARALLAQNRAASQHLPQNGPSGSPESNPCPQCHCRLLTARIQGRLTVSCHWHLMWVLQECC